jgi:hypothetical protein
MDNPDARDDIERLEARIETLADVIERCRMIALASKLAVAAGATWLALMLLGLAPFVPAGFIVAAAATIGGIVLFGSNFATWKESELARREAEALRTELIERLDLRGVGARRLH